MTGRTRYYDIDGRPLTRSEYLERFTEDDFERTHRVAKDNVGEASISTVHLAIDHSFVGGPPLIFETMIFGGDHDGEQWRYSTREAAEDGHRRIVEALGAGEAPPQELPIGAET